MQGLSDILGDRCLSNKRAIAYLLFTDCFWECAIAPSLTIFCSRAIAL
ncbi:MAG: hypothetical protein VKL59_01460 [Nostocaceae cyanobacterium]|nr:hypothetical protein [Nostocaceae cyanobacterium]